MGLCLPRSRCASAVARRPSVLPSALTRYQSRRTESGLAEMVFMSGMLLLKPAPGRPKRRNITGRPRKAQADRHGWRECRRCRSNLRPNAMIGRREQLCGQTPSTRLYNGPMPTALTWPDRLIAAVEQGLRAVAAPPVSMRPSPAAALAEPALSADERSTSAALMRVNHAGEIAAQALYSGQALFARSPATEAVLSNAAREERDHLAWCAARIDELGGRTSLLTPFWYAGSFAIGVLAGLRA